MNAEYVSVVDAAKELGMSPTAVRIRMERGLLDIGECLPSLSGNQIRHYVYRSKLNKVLGRNEEDNN